MIHGERDVPERRYVAHSLGLLWFVNLASPILNIAMGRPDVPSYIYLSIVACAVLSHLAGRSLFQVYYSPLILGSVAYLLYSTVLAAILGTRSGELSFLFQGASAVFATMVLRSTNDWRIMSLWIAWGAVFLAVFLTWQSQTGYLPPWFEPSYFLHDVGGFIRAGEGFGEKNYSAAIVLIGLLYCWMITAYQLVRANVGKILIACCAAGIFFTFSRGAFVALLMVLFYFSLSSKRHVAKAVKVAFVLLPVIFFFMGSTLELFLSRFSLSNLQDLSQAMSRVEQLKGGAQLLLNASVAEILFGYGPFVKINTIVIHNIPMAMLVEQGLLGLGVWLGMISLIFICAQKEKRRGNIFPMLAFLAFLTTGMFIRIEVERVFWLLLMFVQASSNLKHAAWGKLLTQRNSNFVNVATQIGQYSDSSRS